MTRWPGGWGLSKLSLKPSHRSASGNETATAIGWCRKTGTGAGKKTAKSSFELVFDRHLACWHWETGSWFCTMVTCPRSTSCLSIIFTVKLDKQVVWLESPSLPLVPVQYQVRLDLREHILRTLAPPEDWEFERIWHALTCIDMHVQSNFYNYLGKA